MCGSHDSSVADTDCDVQEVSSPVQIDYIITTLIEQSLFHHLTSTKLGSEQATHTLELGAHVAAIIII